MTSTARLTVGVALFAGLVCLVSIVARAASYPPIPPSLTTPDQVETSIGLLKFRDGVPDQATADELYDQLDCSVAFPPISMDCAAFRSWPHATVSAPPASRTTKAF